MKRNHLLFTITFLLILVGGLVAEEAKKKPTLHFGLIERMRIETADNHLSLNKTTADNQTYTRLRSSLWFAWQPTADVDVNLKFTNEHRVYLAPKTRDFNWHELVVDYANVVWRNAFKLPLTLSVGRQDMVLGEGFLIQDGTPLDGSRTFYFNAVRADYTFGKKKHKLTAFFFHQPYEDNLMPRIELQNTPKQGLVEQSENGFGLYFTLLPKKGQIEPYIIVKTIDDDNRTTANPRPIDSTIYTPGLRLVYPFTKALSATVEGAVQFGKAGDEDRSAWGGYVHLDYKTGWKKRWQPEQFTIGSVLLSGDDPTTAKMEGWDPLFSRFPKWSESYIYTLIKESRVAYWSNFASLYGQMAFRFSDNVRGLFTYQRMMAMKAPLAGAFPGGKGKTRGDLWQMRMLYDITKKLSGHLIWEHFVPGNFYFAGANKYHWLRFELLWKL